MLLSSDSRPLRRSLRPLVWVILEEVALDAVVEDGRLVARTSARQVAERLGIDPGTAAGALRTLRERGLLSSSRETGPAGRFGLAVYTLESVPGLSVGQPRMAEPLTESPALAQPGSAEAAPNSPCVARPRMDAPVMTQSRVDTAKGRPDRSALTTIEAHALDAGAEPKCGEEPSCRRSPPPSALRSAGPGQCPGQEAFDLGSVSS